MKIKLAAQYLFILISGLADAQNWQLVWFDEFTTEIGPQRQVEAEADGGIMSFNTTAKKMLKQKMVNW